MTTQTSVIRVLLADDSESTLGVLSHLLQFEPDLEVVATLRSSEQLLATIEAQRPDVLLIDVSMPGESLMDQVREAAERWPGSRALVFSGCGDQETVDSAIRAGAWGFVSKGADLNLLAAAVRVVAGGRSCFMRG